jgi:hypothetical protein
MICEFSPCGVSGKYQYLILEGQEIPRAARIRSRSLARREAYPGFDWGSSRVRETSCGAFRVAFSSSVKAETS